MNLKTFKRFKLIPINDNENDKKPNYSIDTLPGLLTLGPGRCEGNNARMSRRKGEKAMLSAGRVPCK